MTQSFFNSNSQNFNNQFNINDFKTSEYLKKLYNPEKQYQAAEINKEQELTAKAEEAVKNSSFLSLTMGEKLAELGIGEHVLQHIAETATGMVTGIVNPFFEYLKNIEIVLDREKYDEAFRTDAKQMFFASQAMAEEAKDRLDGQKFAMFM